MASAGKKRKSVMKRYVHADLVREILVCLPCKSLSRFKSVSKLFSSFPIDVEFIEEHRKRNMKPSHYLTWDTSNGTSLHVFSLSSDKYSHVKTIATHKYRMALPFSYGLVCLHGWDTKSIALFNPVSEKFMSLPDMPSPFAFETRNKPGMPTPTTWRNNYLGFGFDLESQKYKVVQFVGSYIQPLSECYVLTVNVDSSWRRIDVSDKTPVHFRWLPIYADGALYWEITSAHEDIFIKVFVFDLSTEKMNFIESPTKFRFDRHGLGKHLTSLQGKLACVELTPPVVDMSLTITIWKLNVIAGLDWILWYKLEIYNSMSSEIWSLYPLYIDGEKRIICEGLGNLYCYSIEKKSLEVYPVSEKVEGVACYPYNNMSIIHSETLLSSINL